LTTVFLANPDQAVDNLMNALVYAQIFNDERDLILAKWNQLQAFYGTGKVFYQNMVIDVQEDNRLTRFKVCRSFFIFCPECNLGLASLFDRIFMSRSRFLAVNPF
jgi:nuclear pore complex protein Nup54